MGAATPHPLGGTPPRGRRRVGRRARRGGRAPRTGGRPRSIRCTPRVITITGGMPATTARRRRVGSSGPFPGRVRGRRVSLAPPPTMFVPSWGGSFVGGVCEGYPVLGVFVALHPSSHREPVAAAAVPGRVVTPSGRRAKGGRGRDATAYPTAPHTVIANATAATRRGGGRHAPVSQKKKPAALTRSYCAKLPSPSLP